MSVTGVHYHTKSAYNTHDYLATHSVQYNFAPAYALAQTSLSAVDGGGLIVCGIRQYRIRPVHNGADQDVNFSWNYYGAYPPSVSDLNMVSVTAVLEVSGGDQCGGYMTLNVWFLG